MDHGRIMVIRFALAADGCQQRLLYNITFILTMSTSFFEKMVGLTGFEPVTSTMST